jgi:hypothetical protein
MQKAPKKVLSVDWDSLSDTDREQIKKVGIESIERMQDDLVGLIKDTLMQTNNMILDICKASRITVDEIPISTKLHSLIENFVYFQKDEASIARIREHLNEVIAANVAEQTQGLDEALAQVTAYGEVLESLEQSQQTGMNAETIIDSVFQEDSITGEDEEGPVDDASEVLDGPEVQEELYIPVLPEDDHVEDEQ